MSTEPSGTSGRERSLSSSPSMPLLFARAGAAMLPLASHLPFLPGGGGSGAELPATVLRLEDVAVDRERLSAYNRVCGFPVSDVLPATYPHMLAFPLHLAVMTDGRFPFGTIGLVHIANRITQRREIDADERLTIAVWADDLRPHPRGMQFSLISQARVGDELVWESVSTNLRRGSGSAGPAPSSSPSPSSSSSSAAESGSGAGAESGSGAESGHDVGVELPPAGQWRLPGDLGRRYASVSGDHNPIHLSALTARLFGFPSAIAHGMWTKARCLAALAGRLPAAYTVAVEFKRPILLPATVTFATSAPEHDPAGAADGVDAAQRGEIAFAVRDSRRSTPHLTGMLTPRI